MSVSGGSLIPQNLPSCVAVHNLDVQSNQLVLDCCAAPGGKSSHLASLLKGTGRVVAVEKSQKRFEEMVERLCDYKNIQPLCANSCTLTRSRGERASIQFEDEEFDRVLLDAPCSGSGLRPRLRPLNEAELDRQVQNCVALQRKLLESIIPLLKTDGVLIYSTCSVTLEENEENISWILSIYPELQVEEQKIRLGTGGVSCPGLDKDQAAKLQRFHLVPNERNRSGYDPNSDTIGFFIAKLRKR